MLASSPSSCWSHLAMPPTSSSTPQSPWHGLGGRSGPSPSHPTVTPRGEGLQGWGGRLLLCSGMVDGGGGRAVPQEHWALDTSRLLPASHPLHCCFLCFLGVRGTLDYTSSVREPVSPAASARGQEESVNWQDTMPLFARTGEKKEYWETVSRLCHTKVLSKHYILPMFVCVR